MVRSAVQTRGRRDLTDQIALLDVAPARRRARYDIILTDAFEWLAAAPRRSIHAVVTDPPYGLLEYSPQELAKLKRGRGGVWRIPPSFDGCRRRPFRCRLSA